MVARNIKEREMKCVWSMKRETEVLDASQTTAGVSCFTAWPWHSATHTYPLQKKLSSVGIVLTTYIIRTSTPLHPRSWYVLHPQSWYVSSSTPTSHVLHLPPTYTLIAFGPYHVHPTRASSLPRTARVKIFPVMSILCLWLASHVRAAPANLEVWYWIIWQRAATSPYHHHQHWCTALLRAFHALRAFPLHPRP